MFSFVLMPFSDEFIDIFELGIKETANALGIKAERLKDQIYDNDMLQEIFNQIESSDFIIADMSTRNSNVFYEVGYAHAKNKIVILLAQNAQDIPFDLQHKPHIIYDNQIVKLKSELKRKIEWAIEEVKKRQENQIMSNFIPVKTKLIRSDNDDTIEITYSLELINTTDKTIKDIPFIYLYTGSGWTHYVDSKMLKCTNDSENQNLFKHTIPFPYQMIPAKDNCLIEIIGKKIVYDPFQSTDRKDIYNLKGFINIVMPIGDKKIKNTFDMDLNVEYDFWEDGIPF